MSRIALKTLVFVLALQQSGAVAAAPRQPTKPWNVDYGESACSASRTYGNDDQAVVFALRPSPAGKVMQMIVVRPGRVEEAEHVPATVSFAGQQLKTTALLYQAEKEKLQIIRINFQREAIEPIRNAAQVDLRLKGRVAESFATPGMAAVLRALEKCNLDLQAYWNVGEERASQFKTLATSVKPLESYVSSRDFPTQALRESRDGRTRVTLMVDETGNPKDCMAEESSGVASFDAQTCIVLVKRAKFHPATDASGKPVRSVLSASIKWVTP